MDSTPSSHTHLSSEIRKVILERNLLTTKTRMKVLSALENMTLEAKENKENKLRAKALNEILTSEASYLLHLELIMKYFMEPMKQNNYISDDDYTTLFGNIEIIYQVNGELLNELKRNQENIAMAFLKLAPFLKLYSAFAYDYQRGLNLLDSLRKKSSQLDEFINNQECRPEVSTKLVSLLITPIQRIPRYCLLLREVISHTQSCHPDFTVLQEAIQQVELSARHINSLMEEHENVEKMLAIQRCFSKGKPQIITPGRKFIKAGKLMKVSRKGSKIHPRYFILLSDMLLYCKILSSDPTRSNSLSCACALPLKKCEVQWIMGKTIFKVSCMNENLLLYSSSHEESESWVSCLEEAIRQFREYRKTLRKGSSSKRPLRGAEINNLWQNSPVLDAGKKRKLLQFQVNENNDVYNQYNNSHTEFHQMDEKENEPSPCKARRISKARKFAMKDRANGSDNSDSLYPMRLEFGCSPHVSKVTGINDKKFKEEEAVTGITPSWLKSHASGRKPKCMNDKRNSENNLRCEETEEHIEENRIDNECSEQKNVTGDKGNVRLKRNSWHNRYYRRVRSFSLNLHQSLRKHIDRLSRYPNTDSNLS